MTGSFSLDFHSGNYQKIGILFSGIGGRFQPEWVAGLLRNRWQVWPGIHIVEHTPLSDETYDRFSKQIGVSSIEFEFSRCEGCQHLPIISATINDTFTGTFLLDTGCGGMVLSPEVAHKLGIKSHTTNIGRAVKEETEVNIANISSVSVGDLKIEQVETVIMTCKDIETDGVIGTSYLKHLIVTINYRRKEFLLCKPSQ